VERVIGIDLGTTNSVVAYYEQGQVVVIPNSEGSKTTPSVVLYKNPEEIIVGELAKRQIVAHPDITVRSVKRFMGARFSEIEEKKKNIHYKLVEGPDDSILIDVGWAMVSPEQVSAEILKKMKRSAEDYFGEGVNQAVITVPAYFNDNQRAATKRAGELANLEVVRIINEPTAAALAFGIEKRVEQRVAVFDLGGGTFDISVLELDRDVFEVKSTNGDTFLGGDNIDESLYSAIVDHFFAETGVSISADVQASQRLHEACEKVKCELSSASETLLALPFLAANETGPMHINQTVSREELNLLIEPILPRLYECCNNALHDAHLQHEDISNVLLVGGSTRIPAIHDFVKTFFAREPNRSLNPDEAVAIGAAIQGSILSGSLREVLLLDVTPLSLGIELSGGVFSILIPRNSSIPTAAHKIFTTVRDNQSSVKIHVLQGERRVAVENHSLGYFRLLGITPAPKEIPEIDVQFQIDANGILNVSATDATSGVSNSITIESYAHVTAEEASEMVRAAESAYEQDRVFIRRTHIKAMADSIMSDLDVVLGDHREPIQPEIEKTIREAIFRFDIAYNSGDAEE
jgi:molecular chaperone DnaK